MAKANLQTATNGSVHVPFDQRDGATSDVFFTRDLSPEGLRQLSYMHELGMGNWKYRLLDLDNGEAEITQAEAVARVTPFEG